MDYYENTEIPVTGEEPAVVGMVEENGNFAAALIAGVVAGFIGSILWALVTVGTQIQSGLMSVGVAFLVGIAIRATAKSINIKYGILGAVISLASCVVGNMFAQIGFYASENHLYVFNMLKNIDYGVLFSVIWKKTDFYDALFYFIALYEGFKIPTAVHKD